MKQEKPHVAKFKKNSVETFSKLLLDYPIIGVLNMENLPSAQLSKMRKSMRSQVLMKMTKKRLIKLAIEKVKDKKAGIVELEKSIKGMPALLFSKDNPFKLYKIIQKSKSSAAAKPGQVCPKDIIIPAGPTQFPPGPIISEFSQLGIKTGVEGGKVAVKQESVLVKENQVINQKQSDMMAKLGIMPMEIGLDLVAVYEDGLIYGKNILSVDEKKYIEDITQAASYAMNLSVETVFITKDNTDILISKVFRNAKAVAMEANILNDVTKNDILAKAYAQMNALKLEANL